MKRSEPPAWMEAILNSLLDEQHREAVSGDLYEEFCDEMFPSLGATRARFWYMRQILSFIPQRFGSVLTIFCLFTMASGAWLGMMDLILQHPGYARREWIAGLIVGQAAVTLAALYLRKPGWLRPLALAGCLAIVALALRALVGVITGANFEGYILLISLALLAQAGLTLLILLGRGRRMVRRA